MTGFLENIQTVVQNQHGLAFIAVFIGGLISAASPCVLAAIPLIIGYVGGYSEGNKKKAALFSLVFVVGLSITFTLLGAAASAKATGEVLVDAQAGRAFLAVDIDLVAHDLSRRSQSVERR